MQNEVRPKVIVIGGGPGGYPAAIKAAQLGAEVVLVDKGGIGGTCLHHGCIPTKFLLKSAKDYLHLSKLSRALGAAPLPLPDLSSLIKQKNEIVGRICKQTEILLKRNQIRILSGTAAFTNPGTLHILESQEELTGSAVIIATGSESMRPPIEGMDLPGVLSSSQVLSLETLPSSLIVIGGGYIGLELAQVFHMLGAKVAVVEMLPNVLSTEDVEISQGIQQLLVKSGIGVHTSAEVKEVVRADGQLQVTLLKDKKTVRLKAEKVLIAVGRRPFHAQLGVDRIGIRLSDNRTIAVNERLETKVPGIFAVGDVVRGPMLAHKATAEGEAAAHFAVGLEREFPRQVIPSVIYTVPEAARVGLTEAEARVCYRRLLIGRFPFAANGRAIIEGAAEGFVKVIAEGEYERIVGTSILGPDAGHLIGEAALAIQMEASLDDVAETIHAHPTLTEAFREAVLDAKGQAIHLPPRSARRR